MESQECTVNHKYPPTTALSKSIFANHFIIFIVFDFQHSAGFRQWCGMVIACGVWVSTFIACAITYHTFQPESSKFDQKNQQILLKVPIVLGTDWPWSSTSNLTSLENSVYLYGFCVLKYLRHVHKNCSLLNCFPSQMTPHIYWFQYTLWHGPWNSLVVYLVWPLLASVSSCPHIILCAGVTWKSWFRGSVSRRLTLDFTSCYRFSWSYNTSHAEISYTINRQLPKQE